MVQLLVQWKESTLVLLNNLSPRHLCEDSDPLPQISMARTKGLISPTITSVWSPSTGQQTQTGQTAACSSTPWFGFPWRWASIYQWWLPTDLQLSQSPSPWGETNVRCLSFLDKCFDEESRINSHRLPFLLTFYSGTWLHFQYQLKAEKDVKNLRYLGFNTLFP